MRWVPPLGVLGAAIGAIAIGTAATSTSTTIIISIRTTISTAMSAARDKVIGSTIRNTAEMHPMGTGKQPISSADVAPVVPVARVVPEDPLVPVVRVARVVPVVRVALVVPENPVVQVASVVLEDPVEPVALVVPENPAVPELETGPVAALELVLVQVAVALRTKSAIAAHRPDLVPAPRVEDSAAAVAETTREPVAAEVGTAWEAAATAVVVVAVAVAVEA